MARTNLSYLGTTFVHRTLKKCVDLGKNNEYETICMQDDQNGQKTMALPSADKTKLTGFILSKKKIFLVANGLVWQLMVTPLFTCLDYKGFSSIFIKAFSF
jgi:hypothetical protein